MNKIGGLVQHPANSLPPESLQPSVHSLNPFSLSP